MGELPKKPKKKKYKKNPEKVLLKDIFELYKKWRSLPVLWRGISKVDLVKMGIEDELSHELLAIRYQSQFCRKYGIDDDTASNWNETMKEEGIDPLERIRDQMNALTKEVVAAHYKKVTRRFDSMSGELWYKFIANWNEKKVLEHTGKFSLLDLAKEVADEEANHGKSKPKTDKPGPAAKDTK